MEIHHLKLTFCLVPLALASAFGAVPDGYVVKADSATVYVDWGSTTGVKSGDNFLIYRATGELKHPITGEVLGQAEKSVGRGLLENVEDKFSIGRLLEGKGDAVPGDRTRWKEVPAEASPIAAAAVAAIPGAVIIPTPKELWRSEPLSNEAVGLAVGDIDGDGKKDVVLASREQIEVFRWNGQKLESLALFKERSTSNFLAVDVADIDGAGHDKIFASLFLEGVKHAKAIVLEYRDGKLKQVGRAAGFIRNLEHADGKRELILQDLSMSRELRVRQPVPLLKEGEKYKEGKPIKLVRALNDDQLLGYAWGDWDGDGAEDLAMLQNGERLRLFFKEAKWSSSERYGGSKADFSWDGDQLGSVLPRLLSLKPGTGKMQLIVPHNVQYSPIRLSRLKIYKEGEIVDLSWNGLEMAPVWKLPVAGMVADFGLGDVMQRGAPQLWLAVVGAGDKTLLIAYQLP